MSLAGPPPAHGNPLVRLALDLKAERAATMPFPPGDTRFSVRRSASFLREPLPILLDAYERFGPVFTIRVFHHNVVYLLGPEANHHVLVGNAENFSWREGHLGDLMPLLGDGLLTVDGAFHRASRRIMLPAFHRERIAAAHGLMEQEVERAIASWRPGTRVDLYTWTRHVALRIAMRALFGLRGDVARAAARDFEQALSFWGKDYALQVLLARAVHGAGVDVPGGVPVAYSSWASHRLPDVWTDPDRFDPQRFSPGRRELIPRGAYVPFGGGSRMCIGMRFGQAEIGVIVRRILSAFRFELDPGYVLRIRQTPTLGPRDGMPMTVRAA